MGFFDSNEGFQKAKQATQRASGDRKLAQEAGGFADGVTRRKQEEASTKLIAKYGKQGAKKRIETEARSAGAKPKLIARLFGR